MNKILIFLLGEFSKLDKVLFDLSVENQNRYLSSLPIPNDDIDRSYLQISLSIILFAMLENGIIKYRCGFSDPF